MRSPERGPLASAINVRPFDQPRLLWYLMKGAIRNRRKDPRAALATALMWKGVGRTQSIYGVYLAM